jgi:hypothetical protein
MDDIVIFSEDKEKHLEHLKEFLLKTREYNLSLNMEKCEFGKQEIELLGHKITPGRIEMLRNKVEVIRD